MTHPTEFAEPPVGWIPPQFREFIYAELTEAELESIRSSMSVSEQDPVTGRWRNRRYTDEEIRQKVQRITGVRDTRTGEIHPQVSRVPMMSVRLGDLNHCDPDRPG